MTKYEQLIVQSAAKALIDEVFCGSSFFRWLVSKGKFNDKADRLEWQDEQGGTVSTPWLASSVLIERLAGLDQLGQSLTRLRGAVEMIAAEIEGNFWEELRQRCSRIKTHRNNACAEALHLRQTAIGGVAKVARKIEGSPPEGLNFPWQLDSLLLPEGAVRFHSMQRTWCAYEYDEHEDACRIDSYYAFSWPRLSQIAVIQRPKLTVRVMEA